MIVALRYAHIARRSRLLFNEISRNKVVVPEGAAGVILVSRPLLLVEFSFTLNYCAVRFSMV